MKNILSILMLFMMLVVGSHPTLAMHFCGDNLRSVDVVHKVDHNRNCCPRATENTLVEEVGVNCTGYEKECCLVKELEISTDSYQNQQRQFNVANILPSFDNIWLTLDYMSPLVLADNSTTILEYFPPEGLNVQNNDILTLICIYRI